MQQLRYIGRGMVAYREAIPLIRSLKLYKFMAIPLMISLFVTLITSLSAWQMKSITSAYLKELWPWAFGLDFIARISGFMGVFGVLFLGFIITKYLVLALSSPFMSAVSDRIRLHYAPGLKPRNNHKFWDLLWRGLRLNISNLLREICLTLLILFLSFIPPFSLITIPFILIVQAYFVGAGNLDYSLEPFFNYRESKSFLNRYRGLSVGNGFLFNLVALIPIFGVIIVLPLSVSAAAIAIFRYTDLIPDKT